MKQFTCRTCTILLSMLLVVALFVAMANSALAFTYSGSCGENVTWRYDAATGTLTISGEGDMEEYPHELRPWLEYRQKITAVVVEDGVTSIGSKSFYGCSNLSSVTIPEGVTSIGILAFAHCESLDDVTIPSSVTSIGSEAFQNCASLNGIIIPDGVTAIENYTFDGCTSLTTATIPDSVVYIGEYAFADCASLTGVVIPDGVTSLHWGVFSNCDSLTSVIIPDDVTVIGVSAFYGCDNLTSVTIPHGVTYIGSTAFAGCENLASVIIPDSVTYLGHAAFRECKKLASVTIGSSVPSILRNTFYNCDSLTTVILPDSVTSIGEHAFRYCDDLSNVFLGNGVASIGEYAFYICESLASVYFGKGISFIDECAFDCLENLTDVYYSGSAEEWEQISIRGGNDPLRRATKHLNYGGHDHSYNSVVTAPTCTEFGYTTYTCGCGDSYVGEYTEPLEHEFGDWIILKEADCTEDGLKIRTCSRCSRGDPQPVDALGHDYANGTCTRCGESDPDYIPENPFADVPENAYFLEPVLWAVENGITSGTGNGNFSPNDTCTRAQVVTFLWRAVGKPAPESGDNPFTDVPANAYYYDAVLWAVENGITSGTGNGKFSPNDPCTRGQVVTFLWRAMGKTAPESEHNPFGDVKSNDYFYNPVLWAVENGITSGTSGTTFAPSSPCTRAQVVTFLYRAMKDK